MKKIIFILIFILVNNCNGYQPVFSSKDDLNKELLKEGFNERDVISIN